MQKRRDQENKHKRKEWLEGCQYATPYDYNDRRGYLEKRGKTVLACADSRKLTCSLEI